MFGGYIRQVIPAVNSQGLLSQLLCKGYAMALEETHCNSDYGSESTTVSNAQPQAILQSLITNFVNKSFAGTNTGWSINNTYISDYCATDIKYINNPYRTCLEVADLVCELTSAIGAGSTPGAHWIVDNSKRFLLAKIGDHAAGASSPETYWPDWWNTDAAGSTLAQGVDFADYVIVDKNEEFANKVVLITDFRRPSYDYITEDSGGAALWGNDGLTSIGDSATRVVGSHSVLFTPNGAVAGYGYYPSAANLNWDITKWGSEKSVPRINFYCQKHLLTTATTYIYMSKNDTARKTDYYYATFLNWATEPDDTWLFKSIPIGPYWACADESRQYRWSTTGSPSWSNVDSVEFAIVGAGAGGLLYVDDLHFSGKIARSAYNSWSILGNAGPPAVTAKNEYQKVLISRNAMDDSCVAADDSGFAARIAYAELLRRQKRPKTIIFTTTTDMKTAMAGQKIHIHAGKKADGTFRLDSDMRMLDLQVDVNMAGLNFTVTATTDLYNSTPISVPDQYAMWQENMFLNSKEAKNIRSGAEVDLLIPLMQKDYQSDDD